MKNRYLSLDIFRGITIAGMILVNTSGNGDYTYSPLKHADWHGFTPTDLVFPSFMFIIGVAMRFSFAPFNYTLTPDLRNKILKRAALLFIISYLIHNFPYMDFSLSHMRIPGVLQRLAIGFAATAFIVLTVQKKYLIYITIGLLLGYWLIMFLFGNYDPTTNAVLYLDRFLLGENHLYGGQGFPFDPEGTLSSIPAIASTLIGYLVGIGIQEAKNKQNLVFKMAAWGVGLVVIAWIWNMGFPINKKLWTSSFVILCVGLDMIILAPLIWIIDIKGKTNWIYFFKVFGMNSIAAYAISEVLAIALYSIPVTDGSSNTSLFNWIYWHGFQPVFGNYNGSLAFAIAFVLVCWLPIWVMFKKGIFWKV
jgi:predicted acyltransferase